MFNRLFSKAGLSLERLRTFCEVADAGSMAKAANGDGVRQSQFSRQIKELEQHLGRKLTIRSGRNVVLSEDGKELAALAREILTALEEFQGSESTRREIVSLGAGDSFLRGVVIPKLGQIRERLPAVIMELKNMRAEDVADALSQGTLDIGVVDDAEKRVGMEGVKIGRVRYRLVASREATGVSGWEAAMRLPFIALEGTQTVENMMTELCRKAGVIPDVVVRCASWHAVADAIESLRGASFLPNTVATPAKCMDVNTPSHFKHQEKSLWLVWDQRRGELRQNSPKWRRVLEDEFRFG